jgi:hypothetical protein
MELGCSGTGWQDRLGGYARLREGDGKDLIAHMNLLHVSIRLLPLHYSSHAPGDILSPNYLDQHNRDYGSFRCICGH